MSEPLVQPGIEDVGESVQKLRDYFFSGKTLDLCYRRHQLEQLKKAIEENKDELCKAIQHDLGKKHPQEVLISEINLPLTEIEHNIHHLERLARPVDHYTPLGAQPAKAQVYKQPLGTVLIMGPWNYPFNLVVVPLAGAIAAGNTVFAKFSRHSSETGKAAVRILSRYLDPELVVFEQAGGAAMITRLMEEHWDHVMFTGSVSVGRIIYQAAAKFLTPVTLELGGKNPCIVDDDVNLDLAAKRIAWGKMFNSGQTCLTADYVLCMDKHVDGLVEGIRKYIREFYGEDPQKSESFPRIISEHHTKRLAGLFKMGKVAVGGKADLSDRYVEPTVIVDPDLDSELMQDEIFGPVLPIVRIKSIDEALEFIRKRPTPLSLYVFSRDAATQEYVIAHSRSGAAVCNDLLVHFATGMPFGGCGESGLGAYHGDNTFDTFTHKRAVIKSTQKSILDLPLRYPPYGGGTHYLVNKVTRSGW